MLHPNKPNIVAAGTVLNTTVNSLAMPLDNMINFSIQITFGATVNGTWKLQASCDPVPAPSQVTGANGVVTYTPTNWTDIANSSFGVAAAGNVQWDYNNCGFSYVRAVFIDASSGSSTGTVTSATFQGKGI